MTPRVFFVTYRTKDLNSCASCEHRWDELFPGKYIDCPFLLTSPSENPITGCRFYKFGNPKPVCMYDAPYKDGDSYCSYCSEVCDEPKKANWVIPYMGVSHDKTPMHTCYTYLWEMYKNENQETVPTAEKDSSE